MEPSKPERSIDETRELIQNVYREIATALKGHELGLAHIALEMLIAQSALHMDIPLSHVFGAIKHLHDGLVERGDAGVTTAPRPKSGDLS